MTQSQTQPPVTRTPLLPRSTLGRWCVALGAVPLILFALLMFVFPLVGMIFGLEEISIGILDTWITPTAMSLLLLASAVTGIAAHRRGERATASEVIMWLSLAAALPLTVFLIGGALSGG